VGCYGKSLRSAPLYLMRNLPKNSQNLREKRLRKELDDLFAPIRTAYKALVAPWTLHNRASACQATLSMGPYLLLKVRVQHRFFSRTFPA
jgi:hypothetical protein